MFYYNPSIYLSSVHANEMCVSRWVRVCVGEEKEGLGCHLFSLEPQNGK